MRTKLDLALIKSEMGYTAPELKELFTGVTIFLVLPNRIAGRLFCQAP